MTHTVKSIESMFSNAVHVMAHQPRRETAKDPECSYAPLSMIRVTTRENTLSRKSSRKHKRQHRPVERSDSSESEDDPSDGHSSDASSVSTSRLFRVKMKNLPSYLFFLARRIGQYGIQYLKLLLDSEDGIMKKHCDKSYPGYRELLLISLMDN